MAVQPEVDMPLEMKPACQRCATATPPDGAAFICTFECTFCPACTEAMARVCPNCGGELAPRPRPAQPQLA